MAHFDLTDKAKIRPEVSGEKVKRHFQVWSKNKVTLPVVEPVGITEKDADGRRFTWKFKYWQEVDGNRKWYIDENTPYVVDEFLKKDTYIKAVFEKDYTSNSEQVETYTTHESAKDDSGNIINNIQLPTFEDLQKQIKIKKGDNFVAIDTLTDPKEKVTVEYIPGDGYTKFEDEIYDKLKEKENPKENGVEKPTRIETIKAQLTYPDGEVKTVDIPIKVIKNIYEAKTETQRPYYVPEEYVKVTLDPTSKATDPQKTYYYVNPKAQVVIPGKNPTGTGNNKFIKWAIGDTEYKLPERHQFTSGTTIEAQYVSDVIPAENNGNKPEGTPDNFVKVTFVPTDKAKDKTEKIFYVNPNKEVTIQVDNPVGVQDYTFKEWKIGEDASGEAYAPTTAKKFDKETIITATYGYYPDVIPKFNDQGKENEIPKDYIEVTFKTTDKGGNVEKTVYVNPDRAVVLEEQAPKVTAIPGYEFARWDTSINEAIRYRDKTVITALYNDLGDISPKEIEGYVKVEFKQGSHGQLQGMTDYWIRPGVEINLIQPIVQANNGYSFDKWDKPLTLQAKAGDPTYVITALYKAREESGGSWQTGTLGPTRTRTVTVVEKEIVKVPAEKTFRKEVRYMQGYNNYFRPGAGLTRAEAAQILANALVEDGYRYDPNFAIHYKDIVGNEWYAKAIRITSQANVFKGYDTGYFDPHKKITRAEWIGTLRRFQELERVSGNHMQVRADHWAMGEIEAAYKEGWLAIYGQGLAKFNADEFIPRQEVAAVSNKAFNRVLDKTYIHRNSKNLINYKDVNPSLWSYEDILCASNGFIHDGKSFWGHKVDYKKDLYNLNLDGYTVTKDKFQRLERR